jgi:hypothetical protein
MALKITDVRAFASVPADMRQWSTWLREAFIEAISGTVDTAELTDLAVTTAKLAALAVTNAKLGPLAVTHDKITAGAVHIDSLGGDITAAGTALLDDANAAAQRTTLGLGTAAVEAIGTSGANVPKLSTANTWTLQQIFSAPPKAPSYVVGGLPSAATSGLGSLAIVTDATLTAITGLGLAPTGGGANKVPVYSDGTNWLML